MLNRSDHAGIAAQQPTYEGIAQNGDIRIAFQRFGPAGGKPLLLLNGVGMQMIMWREEFCAALVDRGFTVVRFDQRDVGESTHLHAAGRPSILRMLLRPSTAPYTLRDMAADAASVLDALDWPQAHIVGISMGGMVAQELAIHHRDRVQSLTSIAATASPRIGRISVKTARRLNKLQDRKLATGEDAGQLMVDLFALMGSPDLDMDEQWLRAAGARAFGRAYDVPGRLRQEAALMAGKDRRAALGALDLPTLVVHGDVDPIWALAAGEATAAAIPGSQLITVPRLGHGLLPESVWPTVLDGIDRLATRAQTGARE
ncbi:MAG TPA: alpha/beta hydrolase [Actinocrinis sp.]|nr:alpha/beta hydrolase [Actinocrinis sp.]